MSPTPIGHGVDRLNVETADTQQVVDIPGDHLVLPIPAGDEGFLAAQLIDIGLRHVPEYDDP